MFCRKRGIDPISTFLDQRLEFLTKFSKLAVGYSSIGAARSVLSSVLVMDNRISFGKHPLVQQFMRGIFNLRPFFTRQFVVWDPYIVVGYLSKLEYDLPLKDLSEKLVNLLCLLFRQRDQTPKALILRT